MIGGKLGCTFDLVTYVRQRNRAEVARVPTPAIVEAEQPHLTRCDSIATPREMPKWTVRAVTRCNGAALQTHAVHRNPSGFDLLDVTGKGA